MSAREDIIKYMESKFKIKMNSYQKLFSPNNGYLLITPIQNVKRVSEIHRLFSKDKISSVEVFYQPDHCDNLESSIILDNKLYNKVFKKNSTIIIYFKSFFELQRLIQIILKTNLIK